MTSIAALTRYVNLLSRFIAQDLTAIQFELEFLHLYKNDTTPWTDEAFAILDSLFADVDAFCSDPSLRDDGDLNEAQLLHRSQVALSKLNKLLQRS